MARTQIPGNLVLDSSITEQDLSFSDITTLNADTTKHGLLPKLPNNANQFINGIGQWVTINANTDISFTSLTTLTIDLNNYTTRGFTITLTSNATFNVTNYVVGREYVFIVYNNSGSAITITMPSNQAVPATTVTIGAGKVREFSLLYNGTKQIWLFSGELINYA